EASKISGTSKEAELRLLNVSRSSLEELLEDCSDFLRKRKVSLWPKNSREALFVCRLARKVVANILICVIHQTNYLLDQLIRKLEKDFLVEGGLRERMTRARLADRATQKRLGYS